MIDIIQALINTSTKKVEEHRDLLIFLSDNFKQNGYFLEFGAHNGLFRSNTYILEKFFNWTGLLCEPMPLAYEQCKKNRPNSVVTNDCIWSKTNELLEFREVNISSGLSTIKVFMDSDTKAEDRKHGIDYKVKTISLLDFLDKYNSPTLIDYFSIDTEGSEFYILNSFDFSKYKFNFINCEHNHTKSREKLYNLLTSNGYTRMHPESSKHNDWYIRNEWYYQNKKL
jgi:FkbM family methyltransferase